MLANLIRDDNSSANLLPERAHSFQLSFAGNNWVKGLNFEINGFYNRADDLIMTNILAYSNASQNKTGGMELMAAYKQPRFTADWNLTWTHTFKSNLSEINLFEKLAPYYLNDIDDNNNAPAIMSNLVLGWQAAPRCRLHTHVLFESRQTSYNIDLEQYALSRTSYLDYAFYNLLPGREEKAAAAWEDAVASTAMIIRREEIPARCIISIGGDYTFGPVTIALHIHNLLGTRYHRSGMNTNVIPQQGRWFMGSITARF